MIVNETRELSKHFNVFSVFTMIIIVAIVVNIIQFNKVDIEVSDRYTAIHNYGITDIHQIAIHEMGNIRQRHAISYYLGKVSRDANVILPSGYNFPNQFTRTELYMFFLGNVNTIERLDYNHERSKNSIRLENSVKITNENYPDEQQYIIAILSSKEWATEFILFVLEDDTVLLLDTCLLSDDEYEQIEELK